jgi:predicted GNAT family N-acyltransferase
VQIIVKNILDKNILEEAFKIRRKVFVEEQEVDEREEYEFEEESHHFIAEHNGTPVGTARWRKTPNGVKLERFAVLKEFRSSGVGSALVQAVVNDIPAEHTHLYLHAQLTAMGLYAKFGFKETGPMFEEAGIQHYKMILNR